MYYKNELFEIGKRQLIPSVDSVWQNIKDEGFLKKIIKYPEFVEKLFLTIINDFARNNGREVYLNQIWKIFAQLEENGIKPNDLKAQALYLRLAKDLYINNDFGGPSVHVIDKAKFLVAALESFDSTLYFFGVLDQIHRGAFNSAIYSYYSDFIRKVAEVCTNEYLAYMLLAEQIKRQGHGNYIQVGHTIRDSAEKIRNQINFDNHFSFAYDEKIEAFEMTTNELESSHKIPFFGDEKMQEELNKFPRLIKKPSKTIYIHL